MKKYIGIVPLLSVALLSGNIIIPIRKHSHPQHAPIIQTRPTENKPTPNPFDPSPTPPNQKENKDTTTTEDRQTTQTAITSVLTIAASVANIVQNPHSPQAVVHGAQGILNSILNIVAAACKRNGTELDQATYILLLSSLEKELQDLIETKKRTLPEGIAK
ncbi:hypothetical protein CVU75_02550 [Candidatus Dependentiae bacterium HGW-Dependentiae-1]|nr:MAG: hypothetical protein CVU75_02550 [Candidatus Dependentiae bacterium HGW-Dependentiae-1]